MTEDPRESISETLARVARADSLHHAMQALVEGLRERYDVWRANLILFTPEGTGLVVANYSPGGGFFEIGTEISLRLTRGIEAMIGELMLGHVVMVVPGEDDLGILTRVVLDEGIKEAAVLPLCRDGAVLGVVTLASGTRGMFAPDDKLALSQLANQVEEKVLSLAGV